MKQKITVFWFRRDLRLTDNAGLFHALKSGLPVLPVFIFDTDILEKLNSKSDARVSFIHAEIEKINAELLKLGSSLKVLKDKPLEVFQKLADEFEIETVFTNRDYEPYSIERDNEIDTFLKKVGKEFYSFKDHVIFEHDEVVKDDGTPYTVFTPYSKKWKQRLGNNEIPEFPSQDFLHGLIKTDSFPIPTLQELGFAENKIKVPKFSS